MVRTAVLRGRRCLASAAWLFCTALPGFCQRLSALAGEATTSVGPDLRRVSRGLRCC